MIQRYCPIGHPAVDFDTETSILDLPRASVVEIALQVLQGAGVELVEWDALLYIRMKVPRKRRDFSYLVPDDRLEDASNILASIDLPLSAPSDLLLKTNDEYAKGRFYRITRSTLPPVISHIVLYPFSLMPVLPSELSAQPPSHLSPSRCSNILVPRPSAACAFLLRAITKYPRFCYTRTVLQSNLEELVLYFFLGYTLRDLPKGEEDEWVREDEHRRIAAASQVIKQWSSDEKWRQGEEWMGGVLAAVVAGDDRLLNSLSAQ
ncbi:hypothetical protein JOM56_010611 [Amanita muscaria]